MSKKKTMIALAVAAVVLVAVFAIMVFGRDSAMYRNITVFDSEGSVKVERDGKSMDAVKNMKLRSGDKVTVGGESSFLRLCLDDDKFVYVDSNSAISLEASGTSDSSKTMIFVEEGQMITEVSKKLKGDSSFEVNSPGTTMAIRGTIVAVSVQKSDGIIKAQKNKAQSVVLEGLAAMGIYNANGSLFGKASEGQGIATGFEEGNIDIPEVEDNDRSMSDVAASAATIGAEASSEVDLAVFGGLLENIRKYVGADGISDRLLKVIEDTEAAIHSSDNDPVDVQGDPDAQVPSDDQEPVQTADNEPVSDNSDNAEPVDDNRDVDVTEPDQDVIADDQNDAGEQNSEDQGSPADESGADTGRELSGDNDTGAVSEDNTPQEENEPEQNETEQDEPEQDEPQKEEPGDDTGAPADNDDQQQEPEPTGVEDTPAEDEEKSDEPADIIDKAEEEEQQETEETAKADDTGKTEETPGTTDTGKTEETPGTTDTGKTEETPGTAETGKTEETPGTTDTGKTDTGNTGENSGNGETGNTGEDQGTGGTDPVPTPGGTDSPADPVNEDEVVVKVHNILGVDDSGATDVNFTIGDDLPVGNQQVDSYNGKYELSSWYYIDNSNGTDNKVYVDKITRENAGKELYAEWTLKEGEIKLNTDMKTEAVIAGSTAGGTGNTTVTFDGIVSVNGNQWNTANSSTSRTVTSADAVSVPAAYGYSYDQTTDTYELYKFEGYSVAGDTTGTVYTSMSYETYKDLIEQSAASGTGTPAASSGLDVVPVYSEACELLDFRVLDNTSFTDPVNEAVRFRKLIFKGTAVGIGSDTAHKGFEVAADGKLTYSENISTKYTGLTRTGDGYECYPLYWGTASYTAGSPAVISYEQLPVLENAAGSTVDIWCVKPCYIDSIAAFDCQAASGAAFRINDDARHSFKVQAIISRTGIGWFQNNVSGTYDIFRYSPEIDPTTLNVIGRNISISDSSQYGSVITVTNPQEGVVILKYTLNSGTFGLWSTQYSVKLVIMPE